MAFTDFLISTAQAAAPTPTPASGGALGQILMLAMFVGIFYFMLWRPQRKRTKEHQQMMTGLQKGDEVVTSGGMLGKVSDMQDDLVLLSLSDRVEVCLQKHAIASVLPKGTLKAISFKTGK